MIRRAFVLFKPSERWMAVLCRNRLVRQGWDAVLLGNKSDGVLPGDLCGEYAFGRGMHGTDSAKGFVRAMLEFAAGAEILAKFDCDIALTGEGSDWLANALVCSRGFLLSGWRAWGGVWSAPRRQVETVSRLLESREPCETCPESFMLLGALRSSGGMEIHPQRMIHSWLPGCPESPSTAAGYTLPSRRKDRESAGSALFNFAKCCKPESP